MMKRQGDILVYPVAAIPSGAVKKEDRVLAEGEATGHRHELDRGEVFEQDGVLYFTVEQGGRVTLTHQEHAAAVFTPGTYKVVRQREYEPGNWRYVQD